MKLCIFSALVGMFLIQLSAHADIHPFKANRVLPSQTNKNNHADVCEDLYKYTCLDDKYQSKYSAKEKELEKNIKNKLIKLKDNIALELGFDSFNKFIFAQLAESNIEILEDPTSEEQTKAIIDSVYGFEEYLSYDLKFAAMKECKPLEERMDALKKELPWNEEEVSQEQKEVADQILADYQKLKQKALTYALNLLEKHPSTMLSKIDSACDQMEGPEKELPKICEGNQLDLILLEITRNSNSSLLDQLKQFIESYLGTLMGSTLAKDTSKGAINFVKNTYLYCYEDNLSREFASEIISNINLKIHRSKSFILGVVEEFYNPKLKEQVLKNIAQVKEEFLHIFETRFPNDTTIDKALADINQVTLGWPELTPKILTSFERDEVLGIELLDKNYEHENRFEARKISFSFTPYLSTFTVINAYYTPEVHYGEYHNHEEINFFPALYQLYEINPWAFRMVLAHEIGHRFDPNVSVINGYNLNPYYDQLLSCWERADSIMMVRAQYGEAVSDYFSALIMAQITEGFDREARRQALIDSAAIHCYLNESASNFDLTATHPHSILRVNGIFGGTPEFREGLGCKSPSSQYVNCSL